MTEIETLLMQALREQSKAYETQINGLSQKYTQQLNALTQLLERQSHDLLQLLGGQAKRIAELSEQVERLAMLLQP